MVDGDEHLKRLNAWVFGSLQQDIQSLSSNEGTIRIEKQVLACSMAYKLNHKL